MAQVRWIDGEFGCSLVCIGSVLSLAVVPTALQKLHKCVTQNTTELLQDTEGAGGKKSLFFYFLKTPLKNTKSTGNSSQCSSINLQKRQTFTEKQFLLTFYLETVPHSFPKAQ